jgi:hypothetical protein
MRLSPQFTSRELDRIIGLLFVGTSDPRVLKYACAEHKLDYSRKQIPGPPRSITDRIHGILSAVVTSRTQILSLSWIIFHLSDIAIPQRFHYDDRIPLIVLASLRRSHCVSRVSRCRNRKRCINSERVLVNKAASRTNCWQNR